MNNIKQTYDFYMEKYERQAADLKKTMEMLNMLAGDLQIEAPFPSTDMQAAKKGAPTFKADQFVGKGLTTAVYEYLTMIGKEVGARPWPEIVQALRAGGFDLQKSKSAEDAARLNILKSVRFRLVGEDSFGLAEWYGRRRSKNKGAGEDEPIDEPQDINLKSPENKSKA